MYTITKLHRLKHNIYKTSLLTLTICKINSGIGMEDFVAQMNLVSHQKADLPPYKYTLKFVVVSVFNIPSTAKVKWRRGQGFKSHPTD